MNYEEQMQSLITKTTVDVVIVLSLIAIILAILWIVPLPYYRSKKINIKQKNQ